MSVLTGRADSFLGFGWRVSGWEFSVQDKKSHKCQEKYVAADDEYLVMRTRVELDPKGNVVKANYSRIQGPFTAGRYLEIKDCYFNPTPNDTNLEYRRQESLKR